MAARRQGGRAETSRVGLLACLFIGGAIAAIPPGDELGYSDTPLLPGTPWHVHDGSRPQPPVITPPTPSTQERPGRPPSDATVLFDGTDLSQWVKTDGSAAGWKVENGHAEVSATGSIETRESFGDCQLHVEWCAPAEVAGTSQGRGNSGVFLMGRYEIQVLDCYQNRTYPDGQTAALYGQRPPDANACLPPGQWQTFDIVFKAPVFDGEKLVEPARATVFHNGILMHHDVALLGATTHRQLATYSAHPSTGPIQLQDHGNPVRYRNIWVRALPAE